MAEVYSLFASDNAQLAQKSLKLLDQVGRTVRLYGVLEGDESFTKVDIPGLYMLRGDVLRRIGKIEEAQNALVIARDNLSPESTRWQGNLYTSEAQLAYTDRDIEGCCKLALDALNVVAVIKSQPNLTKIEHLYESLCKDLKVTKSHSSVKELGTRLVELFQT